MTARGSANGRSKLTAEQALDVHLLARSGRYFQWEIGEAYAISQPHVSLLLHHKRWRHLWNGEQRMTDETKMTESEWQAKLAALQATLTNLAASRHRHHWQTEMAKAVPTDVVSDVMHDPGLRRGVSEPSSILPQSGGQPQVERGSGYRDAVPLGPVPGLGLMDAMMDQADAQDRADLQRRLVRVKKE